MGTLKSSGANLTINADGSGNDIKFQSNGSEVASIDQSGNLALNGTVDGRDIATDGTKLDGIEASADVTDTANVTSAGALMDSEVTNLAQVKAFDSSDYATAAQGTTADAALPKAGGAMTGNITHADNVKAIFGTGNDLEIYHSGSASFISEASGTGELYIRGTNIIFKSGADNDDYIKCNENSDVKLYHSNSEKLATTSGGVSVTGKVTSSDGLFERDSNHYIHVLDNYIGFVLDGAEDMRLENDGDLHVEGDVIAYSTTISDERLKDNIEVVDGALDKVKQLKGVTFNRKQDGQESAGVIAQDVEKVLPQAVKHKALPLHTGDDGLFKTVQYDALHALLIESIKELSARVEELENK